MQRINLKELYLKANKFYENNDYEKAKCLYLNMIFIGMRMSSQFK